MGAPVKVSHGQLELLRANPAAFAARQHTRGFGGPSMFRMWQYALKRIHSESADAAAEYLRETVLSNFKVNHRNERRLDELVDALYEYAAAFTSLGNVVVEVLKPMNLVINPKLTIAGEITRLDLVPTRGYAAFLLSREEGADWRKQMRFPLIQAHFAEKLNCAVTDVAVGIYSVPGATHELHRFSASGIRAAQAEIVKIAARLP
jgi:hypothetical protein